MTEEKFAIRVILRHYWKTGWMLELQLSWKFAKWKGANVWWAKPQQSNGCSDHDLTTMKPALKINQGQTAHRRPWTLRLCSASWWREQQPQTSTCRLSSAGLNPPKSTTARHLNKIGIVTRRWRREGSSSRIDCGSTSITTTCRYVH